MERTPPTLPADPGIGRTELKAVIRRAAELYAAEADADERLSEDEVLRIAAELGIPARHARQALYELPHRPSDGSVTDRVYGVARVAAVRAVPSDTDLTLSRLSDYLTTREYLRPLRQQSGRVWFAPADDAISNLARALSRPSRRHYLARARRVAVAVRPLEPGWCHVRLDVDLRTRRRESIRNGIVFGALGGAGLGAAAFLGIGGAVGDLVGPIGGWVAGILAGGGAFTGTVSAAVGVTATRFRRRAAAARLELEGLLDRLERGQRLEPPPAPWRRRLQISLGRHRRIAS